MKITEEEFEYLMNSIHAGELHVGILETSSEIRDWIYHVVSVGIYNLEVDCG